MDCNKCSSKERCEYRKDNQPCPYDGLGMDEFFESWDGTNGNL